MDKLITPNERDFPRRVFLEGQGKWAIGVKEEYNAPNQNVVRNVHLCLATVKFYYAYPQTPTTTYPHPSPTTSIIVLIRDVREI